MPDNRLVRRLEQTRSRGGKCLIPYVTAGYPNVGTTVSLLRRLDACGCQAVEVGFPFSDSIADGPVIQDSFYRVLDAGFRVDELFAAVGSMRGSVSTALLAMVSLSIVRRLGVEAFARRASGAGFDGLIVPDVPVDECQVLSEVTRACGLCNVLMAAPTSSEERRRRIAASSTGFVYLIAARGITGERDNLAADLADSVNNMRATSNLPVMVGFGIRSAEQVRQVCRLADGAIVGSAIIHRITDGLEQGHSGERIVEAIGRFVDELMTGTRDASS